MEPQKKRYAVCWKEVGEIAFADKQGNEHASVQFLLRVKSNNQKNAKKIGIEAERILQKWMRDFASLLNQATNTPTDRT